MVNRNMKILSKLIIIKKINIYLIIKEIFFIYKKLKIRAIFLLTFLFIFIIIEKNVIKKVF